MSDNDVQKRIVVIAQFALDGTMSILEAARALCPLLHSCPTAASKEDFNLIIGVDSETDDPPVGWVRREWHPDFLPEKDKEIARCELLWGDSIRAVCERILLRNRLPV